VRFRCLLQLRKVLWTEAKSLASRQAGQVRSSTHMDGYGVSFMDYDLGYFDLETRVLEPLENPFGPKVLPM
jgi:hypothetical protein